jgi:hypothetical protein
MKPDLHMQADLLQPLTAKTGLEYSIRSVFFKKYFEIIIPIDLTIDRYPNPT